MICELVKQIGWYVINRFAATSTSISICLFEETKCKKKRLGSMLQICSEWKSFFLKSTPFCGSILWNGVFCSFWLAILTAKLQLWEIHFIENHSKRGTGSNGKEKQNLPWNELHFDRAWKAYELATVPRDWSNTENVMRLNVDRLCVCGRFLEQVYSLCFY